MSYFFYIEKRLIGYYVRWHIENYGFNSPNLTQHEIINNFKTFYLSQK